MNPSPNCVMPKYQLPACTVSGSSASVMTSRYEVTAIPSQKRTNQKMFSASGTRLMLRRKRFNMAPGILSDRRPSQARVYPML